MHPTGVHPTGAQATDAWRSAGVWDAFTNARRIALIGASDRSRFTNNPLAANDALGFSGEIFLVNLRRDTVLGRAACTWVCARTLASGPIRRPN